jgi:DNA modification methylase
MAHGLCRDPDAPKSTDLHCVLVHGTWANDAVWVEPSSAVATALKGSEGLRNAAFYTFKWSGSVRHSKRVDAALLLSSELTAEIARYPNSSWVFVAHSHGGNIVMSAAKSVKAAAVKFALENGLPVHGATMPLALADFLVRYLSEPDDLVVDPFSGWGTTAVAAERNGRRWLTSELMGEYALVHAHRVF